MLITEKTVKPTKTMQGDAATDKDYARDAENRKKRRNGPRLCEGMLITEKKAKPTKTM